MDKRMRTNLLLAATVIALGLVIWLAPGPDNEKPGIELFPAGTTFSRIELRHNETVHLVLERLGDDWRLVYPREVDADEHRVESLVSALQQPAERRYAVVEADLEQLDLVAPQWTVMIDDAELAVGGRTAIGNQRYVRKGEYVYLVNDTISYRLQRQPLDYASNKLLPINRQLIGIELPTGPKVQNTESGWQLVPENPAVSADDVHKLLKAWETATAIRVKPVEAAPAGERVVIQFDQGDSIELVVDIDASSLALIRADIGLRYELARDEARRLLQLEVASQTNDSGVAQ